MAFHNQFNIQTVLVRRALSTGLTSLILLSLDIGDNLLLTILVRCARMISDRHLKPIDQRRLGKIMRNSLPKMTFNFQRPKCCY